MLATNRANKIQALLCLFLWAVIIFVSKAEFGKLGILVGFWGGALISAALITFYNPTKGGRT